MSINRFKAIQEEEIKEEVVQKPTAKQVTTKTSKRAQTKLRTKTFSVSFYPELYSELVNKRLNEAPALSESQYISNLITQDLYGTDLHDPRTGKLNLETAKKLENIVIEN